MMMVLMRNGESEDVRYYVWRPPSQANAFLTNPWLFDHNNGRLWPLQFAYYKLDRELYT